MRAPIMSVKHIEQLNLTTVTAGVSATRTIADAVVSPDANTSTEVVEGAIIKAVYIEFWIRASALAVNTFVFTIEKIPANATSPTAAQMAALFSYTNKKNIFYTSQGLTNDTTSVATPVFKGWVKIPKGKQRMGLSDRLVLSIFSSVADLDFCGVVLFKEYR